MSWQPKHYANAELIAWWEERKIEFAPENGNAVYDNFPDLPSRDNKASQHYTPTDLHYNDCEITVGSGQGSDARTVVRDCQRILGPRPDAVINMTLSLESPTCPKDREVGIAPVEKAPPENSTHVEVLRNSHANASGPPLGSLKSARQVLRLKLRESRRKRWRSIRIPSPPAD